MRPSLQFQNHQLFVYNILILQEKNYFKNIKLQNIKNQINFHSVLSLLGPIATVRHTLIIRVNTFRADFDKIFCYWRYVHGIDPVSFINK